MKLSPQANARRSAILAKATYDLAVWKREDHDRILSRWSMSDPRFSELAEHYSEVVSRAFTAIINSYIEAYRLDGTLIDEDDENKILEEIKIMIDSQHHQIFNSSTNRDFLHPVTGKSFPNIQSQLRAKFDELYGLAAIDLKLAISELLVEQKKNKNKSGDTYNLNVNNLHGSAQLGPDNVQNVNTSVADRYSGIQYRHGKPHIRWSQLKPEVGMQRILEVGDVQVTERDLEDATEIGGDPWVQLHEISVFGLSVKRYALGHFTPA